MKYLISIPNNNYRSKTIKLKKKKNKELKFNEVLKLENFGTNSQTNHYKKRETIKTYQILITNNAIIIIIENHKTCNLGGEVTLVK